MGSQLYDRVRIVRQRELFAKVEETLLVDQRSSHSDPQSLHLCDGPGSRIPEPRTVSFGGSIDPQSGHRW